MPNPGSMPTVIPAGTGVTEGIVREGMCKSESKFRYFFINKRKLALDSKF